MTEDKLRIRVVAVPSAGREIRSILAQQLPLTDEEIETVPVRAEESVQGDTLHAPEAAVAILATVIAGGSLYSLLKTVITAIFAKHVLRLEFTNEKTGMTVSLAGQTEDVDAILKRLLHGNNPN